MKRLVLVIVLIAIILIVAFVFFDYWSSTGGLGKPCTDGCAEPYVCDTISQTCKLTAGSRCRNTSDCTSNATCLGGVCTITISPALPMMTPIDPPFPSNTTIPVTPLPINYPGNHPSGNYDITRSSSSSSSTEGGEDSNYDISSTTSTDNYCTSSTSEEIFNSSISSYSSRSVEHKGIIDITRHNSDTIVVKGVNSIIVYKDGYERKVRTSVDIHMIESFNGKIYCVSDGVLLTLNMKTYERDTWSFSIANSKLDNIKNICTTGNSKNLWIQGNAKGLLFNGSLEANGYTVCKGLRVYGENSSTYIEYNPGSVGILNVNDLLSEYKEVGGCCFNDSGDLILSKRECMIKYVNSAAHRVLRA